MTAVPRDPAFWKRFSVAAHLAEDQQSIRAGTPTSSRFGINTNNTNDGGSSYDLGSPSSSRPTLKHQDSWLESQQRKKHRNKLLLWAVGLGFVAFVTLFTLVIIWLKAHGFFLHGEAFSIP